MCTSWSAEQQSDDPQSAASGSGSRPRGPIQAIKEALLPHSTDPRETALCNGLCVFQQRMIIHAAKTDDQDQRILNPEKSQNREIDSSIRSPNISAAAQGPSSSESLQISTAAGQLHPGNTTTACATASHITSPNSSSTATGSVSADGTDEDLFSDIGTHASAQSGTVPHVPSPSLADRRHHTNVPDDNDSVGYVVSHHHSAATASASDDDDKDLLPMSATDPKRAKRMRKVQKQANGSTNTALGALIRARKAARTK